LLVAGITAVTFFVLGYFSPTPENEDEDEDEVQVGPDDDDEETAVVAGTDADETVVDDTRSGA
jgi:hypothetical protein